jgi:16S rRNA (guanine527-N7)-methyltransferase
MGEEEAQQQIDVPRETHVMLECLVEAVLAESSTQNLISSGSAEHIWSRHILDSFQLLRFAPPEGNWLDLGTGAGFPGLVVAAVRDAPITLVEMRKLRADFLRRTAVHMGISARVHVCEAKVEAVPTSQCAVISARAFAPLPKLLALGERFAAPETIWILPKGRNAKSELEAAESLWQGDFRLEPSITDEDARIIVARDVRRKGRGTKRR